jgi:hypothetical protein
MHAQTEVEKWDRMARDAAKWAQSPEGQAAMDRAVTQARETVDAVRRAQRRPRLRTA